MSKCFDCSLNQLKISFQSLCLKSWLSLPSKHDAELRLYTHCHAIYAEVPRYTLRRKHRTDEHSSASFYPHFRVLNSYIVKSSRFTGHWTTKYLLYSSHILDHQRMAATLQRAPIMPIDTLFSISSSPPISYFSSAASTYLYPRGRGATSSQDSNPHISTSSVGLSLHDVNCLSNGMFTNSITPYNSNKFPVRLRAAPKMPKESQPLRSCLRVKTVQSTIFDETSDPNSSKPPTTESDLNGLTSDLHNDLEDQMDRLRVAELISPVDELKEKKKVVFADSKGLALASIKFLDGPSDLPPVLSEDLLKHIIQGAKPEPDHPFNYVADFEQPASNYLEFRERVEHKFVSLENVMIKDNITVMGTIKVKNIAFEKSVYLRVTFNDWRTSKDIYANYVPQSNVSASRYDAFGFEFDIPPNQGGKQLEFCICYESEGRRSFWDNNEGNNYRIVSQERRVMTQQQKEASYYSSLSGHNNWGEFSFWKNSEDETPYW